MADDIIYIDNNTSEPSEHNSTWQDCFKGCINRYFGYVNTVEEALTVMKQYELHTTSRFSCFKSDKNFGTTGR